MEDYTPPNHLNTNYIVVLLTSLAALCTSGGVFQHFLEQQMDNTTMLDKSICDHVQVPLGNVSNVNMTTMTMTENIFMLLFSIVLPMSPLLPFVSSDLMIFIKPIIAETVFTHMIGQASAFASTEALQYLIVYPNVLFYEHCGLQSKDECENKFINKNNDKIFISQICNNAIHDNNSILASNTHSLPQLAVVMLGASVVMFVYCYKTTLNVVAQQVPLKYTQLHHHVMKTKSCKLSILVVVVLMVGLCIYYSYKQHLSWTESMYSFFSGVILQCLFIYILKFKKTYAPLPTSDEETGVALNTIEKKKNVSFE